MNQLIKHIRQYASLSDEDAALIPKWLTRKTVSQKEYLLEEGQTCNARFFVNRGLLRMYFIKENGNEQIVQFAIENWWLCDYMSFATGQSSSFYIQAVEESDIIRLDAQAEKELFEELPQMERYFRLVLQRAYAASQFRIKFLYGFSREELYTHFSTHFPDFMQRVPQYMLASYLGFTPEYLSEIRRKKSEGLS